VPLATTEKLAVWPGLTVWLAGCVVTDGATGAAVTVSVALLLATLLTELLTKTLNSVPLSPAVVAGVV